MMIDRHLDVGGAVVFWSLADWSSRERLHAGLAPLGLGHCAPDPRPASAALRDALDAVLGGPRVLVRPLARRDGFAVVREQRGDAGNDYTQDLVATVHDHPGGPSLRFAPWDDRAAAVEDAYRRQLGRVPASQLGAALVKVIDALGGTRLRPSGAVYWLPGHRLAEWQAAAAAVEFAFEGTPGALYLVRHRLDADAVRAVRDAVVAEVQGEARRIHDEVLAGELGGRALEARRRQAGELRAKVLLYEEMLDVGLGGLHRAVEDADQAAAAAALLISAGGVPAESVVN
jgi:hypothetical protein